ncbi:MAG: putative membrane protein YfcA, partial [Hydrogenophaga sp.]
KLLAPGIVIGAAIASLGVFALLKGAWLALVFAIFVAFSATQMLLNKKPEPSRTLPGTAGTLGAGTAIGFLSGLVGAGGGFVSVPFMTRCNVAIHTAVATSAALGFPIALANALGYLVAGQGLANLPPGSAGYIYLPALAVIASASVLMAPLGVRVAHALPIATLKRVFASVLYLLAAYMAYKGLSGLSQG